MTATKIITDATIIVAIIVFGVCTCVSFICMQAIQRRQIESDEKTGEALKRAEARRVEQGAYEAKRQSRFT